MSRPVIIGLKRERERERTRRAPRIQTRSVPVVLYKSTAQRKKKKPHGVQKRKTEISVQQRVGVCCHQCGIEMCEGQSVKGLAYKNLPFPRSLFWELLTAPAALTSRRPHQLPLRTNGRRLFRKLPRLSLSFSVFTGKTGCFYCPFPLCPLPSLLFSCFFIPSFIFSPRFFFF